MRLGKAGRAQRRRGECTARVAALSNIVGQYAHPTLRAGRPNYPPGKTLVVLTPQFKMFREKAEYAAAYITDYVRERLAGARHKEALRKLYDGRPVSPGYRVDYERNPPDGSDNPTTRSS